MRFAPLDSLPTDSVVGLVLVCELTVWRETECEEAAEEEECEVAEWREEDSAVTGRTDASSSAPSASASGSVAFNEALESVEEEPEGARETLEGCSLAGRLATLSWL